MNIKITFFFLIFCNYLSIKICIASEETILTSPTQNKMINKSASLQWISQQNECLWTECTDDQVTNSQLLV